MRKTISITNTDVLKHLDMQGNQSKYIENLILADMDKVEVLGREDIEQLVEQSIQRYVQENGLQLTAKKDAVNKKLAKSALGIIKRD